MRSFSFYPTKELLSLIDDKNIAINLLSDSAAKEYILMQQCNLHISVPNLIRLAVRENDFYVYSKLIGYINKNNRNKLAELAAEFSRDILSDLIKRGVSDWNKVIYGSIRSGDREFFKSIIIQAKKAIDVYTIAEIAAKRGDTETVFDMIRIGATNWHDIAYNAARGGHMALLDCVIKDKTMNTEIWNRIAYNAARGGHKDILESIISSCNDYDLIAYGAAIYGDLTMVDYNTLDEIVYGAAKGGHIELVKEMVKSCDSFCWGEIAFNAAQGGHINLLNYAITMMDKVDWSEIAIAVKRSGCRDIFLLVIDKVNTLFSLIESVMVYGYEDIAHMIINDKGFLASKAGQDNCYKLVKMAIDYDLDSIVYRLSDKVEDIDSIVDYAISVDRSDLANKIKTLK